MLRLKLERLQNYSRTAYNLNYTMLRLKQFTRFKYCFSFSNLNYTMLRLKLEQCSDSNEFTFSFKLHYVKIETVCS